jgi:type II secretory pathway pseudopilin PulG
MGWTKVLAAAALAAALAWAWFGVAARATDRVPAARADIQTLEKAVQAYRAQKGWYPETLQALVDDGVVAATSLTDPWRRRYRYDAAGTKNRGKKPDIWTVTPDEATLGNWAAGRK